jgi:nucleoside-diphosphate-sugar epimerase
VNVQGTLALAQAARGAGVRRFVYVSSAKVHGEESTRPFNEDDRPQPVGPYAVSKWEAEQALAQLGGDMEVAVLRPPLVYGPRVRGNFLALLRAVAHRWPLPLGAIENRRSLIYVENLSDAIARAVTSAEPTAGTFLVTDGEDLSTVQIVRALAQAMGVGARLWPVPGALLSLAGTLVGRRAAVSRLIGSLQFDDRRFRERFAWSPPYTATEGLADTARWFAQGGDSGTV